MMFQLNDRIRAALRDGTDADGAIVPTGDQFRIRYDQVAIYTLPPDESSRWLSIAFLWKGRVVGALEAEGVAPGDTLNLNDVEGSFVANVIRV
jgi:hypothetical protein